MSDDIPYTDDVVARTYAAIDDLITKHPSKALQALEKSPLQGWFAAKIMKQFGGYGDYAGICHMVEDRLHKRKDLLARLSQNEGDRK